ncbi:hypothetical protein DICPUDRAFT_148325 [Dictyostelium purpureum]|uniref:F-box domain-containing protein n=1 Tax=Dictyostelium purpureum TaxID=5786 RepID=F0ZAU1_DICPU|nr:uncharacterized protein DICPUDRAFT_148325 [Dictyostelium purpureum]EGC38978.1 hypothetical protein DICPUDRAFT_148325 [Dictyostelium purpureum]|eukprot:XP_003284543.1 hypothetical protein DICPUDRAFT_148325 [Dictyostelium purpureum]
MNEKIFFNNFILKKLFSNFDVLNLIPMQFVCKKWNQISNSNSLWLDHICKHLLAVYDLVWSPIDGFLYSTCGEYSSMAGNGNGTNLGANVYKFNLKRSPSILSMATSSIKLEYDAGDEDSKFNLENLPPKFYKNIFIKLFYQYYFAIIIVDKHRQLFLKKHLQPAYDTIIDILNSIKTSTNNNNNNNNINSNINNKILQIQRVIKELEIVSSPIYSQFSLYKTSFKQRELYFKSTLPKSSKTVVQFLLLNNIKNQFNETQDFNNYHVSTEFFLFCLFNQDHLKNNNTNNDKNNINNNKINYNSYPEFQSLNIFNRNNSNYKSQNENIIISSLKSVQFKVDISINFKFCNRSVVQVSSSCKFKFNDYSKVGTNEWKELYNFKASLDENGKNGVVIGSLNIFEENEAIDDDDNPKLDYIISQYESHDEYSSFHFPVNAKTTKSISEYLQVKGSEIINTLSAVLDHRKFEIPKPKKDILLNYQLASKLYNKEFFNSFIFTKSNIGFNLLKLICYGDENIICEDNRTNSGIHQIKKILTIDIGSKSKNNIETFFIHTDIRKPNNIRNNNNNNNISELYLTLSDFSLKRPPIVISNNKNEGNTQLIFPIDFIQNDILKFLNLDEIIDEIVPFDGDSYNKIEKNDILLLVLKLLINVWRLDDFIKVEFLRNDNSKFQILFNYSNINNNVEINISSNNNNLKRSHQDYNDDDDGFELSNIYVYN